MVESSITALFVLWVYLSFGLYLGGLVFYINTRNLEVDILLGVVHAWIAHEMGRNCMLSLHARECVKIIIMRRVMMMGN